MYGIFTCSEKTITAGRPAWLESAYTVRGFYRNSHRCRWRRVYARAVAAGGRACAMGAGSFVAARNGASVFGGAGRDAASCDGQFIACGRRALGDGRRAAMSRAWGCRGRDLGGPCRAGFYGDQAVGLALGNRRRAMLANAAGGCAQSKRGTRSLADQLASFCTASIRPAIPRKAALVAGSFPVPSIKDRAMGGGT